MKALDLVRARDKLLQMMCKGIPGFGQELDKIIQRNIRLANASNRLERRLEKLELKK